MGFLKTRRFIPPWGKIYFVLEGPSGEMALPGGQTRLTAYIKARSEGKPVDDAHPSGVDDSTGRDALHCAVAAFVGVVSWFLSMVLFPSPQARAVPAGWPAWLKAYTHIEMQLSEWPWNLAVFCFLILIILALRFRHRAWILAFLAGLTLPAVISGSRL